MYQVDIEGECRKGILFLVKHMEILNGSVYFSEFIDIVYHEWKDEFYKNFMLDKESVSEFYKQYLGSICIYVVNKKIIGCYNLVGNLISDVCVIPEMRRKGIGKMMIKNAISKLWYYPSIELYCKPTLIRFYGMFGFVPQKEVNGNVKMVRMNLPFILSLVVLSIIVCFLIMCK